MKKISLIILVFFVLISCSTEKEGNMTVSGTIKGLKKGTFLLQKVRDTALVTVDSIAVLDKNTFLLSDDVATPELYYLTFDGNSTKKSIPFFGEQGSIIIDSETELFDVNPEIIGSENQKVYEEFLETNKQFSNQNLEFIKREFDYKKDKKIDSLQELQKEYARFMRRKYFYVTNFAINNKDYEVAPFLALTQLSNANVKLLDTINNSLSEKVKQSMYGRKLDDFIKNIKKDNN